MHCCHLGLLIQSSCGFSDFPIRKHDLIRCSSCKFWLRTREIPISDFKRNALFASGFHFSSYTSANEAVLSEWRQLLFRRILLRVLTRSALALMVQSCHRPSPMKRPKVRGAKDCLRQDQSQEEKAQWRLIKNSNNTTPKRGAAKSTAKTWFIVLVLKYLEGKIPVQVF